MSTPTPCTTCKHDRAEHRADGFCLGPFWGTAFNEAGVEVRVCIPEGCRCERFTTATEDRDRLWPNGLIERKGSR